MAKRYGACTVGSHFNGNIIYSARHLNAQELGDDIAVGLGVPLTKSRVFMLLLSTALIGEQLPSPEELDLSV